MLEHKINEREDRIERLNKTWKQNINPFPNNIKRTHKNLEVLEEHAKLEKDKDNIVLVGRLRSKRSHGNLSFINLEDQSGAIQIALSKKETLNYKDFLKLIDIGDFLEVQGSAFTTQKGEKSILASDWRLIAKAIRPLPDKFHGLSDDDKRQRFRELEMIANRDVLKKFQKRFKAIEEIRKFMWQADFTEVETPILQNVYGGTYAKPFVTHYNELKQDFYLRIAPEMFLKRTVVGGFERVFEIGKCFRNEGMGPAHLQEFTMFEFYWAYSNYEKLMEFSEEIIKKIVEKVYKKFHITYGENIINLKPPFPRVTFAKLLKQYLDIELEEIDSEDKLKDFIEERGLEKEVNLEGKVSWASMMDEVYKKLIRKNIVQPVFVTDYPKDFMALAKTKEDDPDTVATFQLVVNGWELIKAYNELNDPIDQQERFEDQDRLMAEGEEEAMPYDKDYVESMEYGMPPMAGWGMGLDRFFALLEEEQNIRDMVMFPTMKNKNSQNSIINENQGLGIDYQGAQELVAKYITDENTKKHSIESEAIMRALAKHFGEDEEKWGIIGLLHDIDWDLTKDDVKNHTVKAVDILKEAQASDYLIESILSHTYGSQECGSNPDKVRSTKLEYSLVAAETMTGLIIASALMQPDKKLSSVKISSLKKKFKQKSFAANCNRENIKEIEKTGLSLDEFFEISLKSLQKISDDLGL
jgi:lysyl-tRNA synthetase class 2